MFGRCLIDSNWADLIKKSKFGFEWIERKLIVAFNGPCPIDKERIEREISDAFNIKAHSKDVQKGLIGGALNFGAWLLKFTMATVFANWQLRYFKKYLARNWS